MSLSSGTRFNFDGQILFKILVTESFTVPDSVAASSPTGSSSGLTPDDVFATIRGTVGGELFCEFSDVAGPDQSEFVRGLKPGDVVAVGAIGSGVAPVTINGTLVREIPATAFAGVMGFYA